MKLLETVKTFGKPVAGAFAADLFVELTKHLAAKGAARLNSWDQNAKVKKLFETQVVELTANSGFLVGFSIFEEPGGKTHSYGPYILGKGSGPADPLVRLGISNEGIEDLGASALAGLTVPAGLKWQSMGFYWVFKAPDGRLELFEANASELHAQALATGLRQRLLAVQSSSLGAVAKLAEQRKLYNELEDRMREELRSRSLEAKLASARQAMAEADREFGAALARRDAALNRIKEAAAMQSLMQLFNIAGSLINVMTRNTASADYEETAAQNSSLQYNRSVDSYIIIIRETSVDSRQLPTNPKISVPPRP